MNAVMVGLDMPDRMRRIFNLYGNRKSLREVTVFQHRQSSSTGVTKMLDSCNDCLAAFGAAALLCIALKISISLFHAFKVYVLGRMYAGTNLRTKGEWAVVTGATDGIGKEYAFQLAGSGINIILISRTEAKLADVATAIEEKFKVKTKKIAADFSQGVHIYDRIKEGLDGLDIGVLVNNVGLSYEYPEYFLDVPDREKVFMNLLHVNCTSVTMMTSIVLPSMVKKKNGVIINIASGAGTMPSPLLTVYSACKAYVNYLSRCLHYEYKDKGILVQCVNPYFVCSNMSKIKRPSLFIPSPNTYVKSALSTVGIARETNGYWPHAVMDSLINCLPCELGHTLGMKILKKQRASYLKKRSAKKAE